MSIEKNKQDRASDEPDYIQDKTYLSLNKELNECEQSVHQYNYKLSEEIYELAKTLYLTPNPERVTEHLFNIREIVGEIHKKFGKKYSDETVRQWVIRKGWNKMWAEGHRITVESLSFDISEIIKNKVDKENANNREHLSNINNLYKQNYSEMIEITALMGNLILERLKSEEGKKVSLKVLIEGYDRMMKNNLELEKIRHQIACPPEQTEDETQVGFQAVINDTTNAIVEQITKELKEQLIEDYKNRLIEGEIVKSDGQSENQHNN